MECKKLNAKQFATETNAMWSKSNQGFYLTVNALVLNGILVFAYY